MSKFLSLVVNLKTSSFRADSQGKNPVRTQPKTKYQPFMYDYTGYALTSGEYTLHSVSKNLFKNLAIYQALLMHNNLQQLVLIFCIQVNLGIIMLPRTGKQNDEITRLGLLEVPQILMAWATS